MTQTPTLPDEGLVQWLYHEPTSQYHITINTFDSLCGITSINDPIPLGKFVPKDRCNICLAHIREMLGL